MPHKEAINKAIARLVDAQRRSLTIGDFPNSLAIDRDMMGEETLEDERSLDRQLPLLSRPDGDVLSLDE